MKQRFWAGIGALATATAMLMGAPQFASAQDTEGMQVPSVAGVSPALKAARVKGDFTAKIAPRNGYKGPLLIGNLPEQHLQTPRTPTAPGGEAGTNGASIANPPNASSFSPDDLGWYGGPTVAAAGQVNTYWGRTNGVTWGNPAQYLAHLNVSPKIKMLDYYTGNAFNSGGQYPSLGIYWYGGSPGSLVFDSNIVALVQAEATYDRASRGQPLGYSNIYHVFTPPGTDVCFDNPANGCYNPDGLAPGPFAFCGYHSYTQLGDGTVVLYTVEPFTNVNGCNTGNGLASATANVLGHEVAEIITDPIPGTGWVGQWPSNSGTEIGDICSWVPFAQTIGALTWYVQDWYSDKYHACTNVQ